MKVAIIMKIRKSKTGFTLVEVLVVVAMMGIILAIAVPSLIKYMPHLRLKRAAFDISSELNGGRLSAITKNTKYRLEVTLYSSTSTPDTYKLSIWNTATSVWDDEPQRPVREIPIGVDIITPASSFNVDFWPDGSATATSICLENTADTSDRRSVDVDGATGRISIGSIC